MEKQNQVEKPSVCDSHSHSQRCSHTALRQWVLVIFIAIIMFPMVGKSTSIYIAELTDNPIQTTSIPQFDQVNKLISANRIDEAIAINDAIAPKNLIEKNHKIANGIYLQSWAKGRFDLTDDERATLLQIATQPHIQGGYGVITAWVMLNRIYRTESVKPKNIIKPFGIQNNGTTIYPNPAREQVTVNGASEILYVLIYDVQGRELLKYNNYSGISALSINISKLKKGIYIIKLVRSDLSDEKVEKLIIE